VLGDVLARRHLKREPVPFRLAFAGQVASVATGTRGRVDEDPMVETP
jgi:hypothetical protein